MIVLDKFKKYTGWDTSTPVGKALIILGSVTVVVATFKLGIFLVL